MKTLLQEHYGIINASLTKMEGYDSTNFKVETGNLIYVLKQYEYSKEIYDQLVAENEILLTLQALKNFDFPIAISSKDKKFLVHDKNHIYRLLSFIEGSFLGDIDHTPKFLQSFGKFLGQLDKVIYTNYSAAIFAKETQWDLQYFKKNQKFIAYISDPKDRSLVDYFFLQFDEQIYPIQHLLRKGIIHNDANDWNVLTKKQRVSGIIDFGDICHSWLINEIAVAITYVMMEKENPLEIASEVINGYCSYFSLEEIELHILYYLVACRLCTSVCNSAFSKTIKPNSEYITLSEQPAWRLLRKWIVINPIKAEDCFKKAAGFEPNTKPDYKLQLKKRKDYLSETLSLSYKRPIQMHGSAFQYMYDTEGNTFLDAYNNIMLAGHCQPHVVRAGQRTMAKLNTNTRYIYDEILAYSEKLLLKFPSKLNKLFFVNSGSAASDLGLRMAFQHTKKNKILALEHAYHGNTQFAIDVSHYKYANSKGTGQKDFVLKAEMPKEFGSKFEDSISAGIYFSEIAEQKIDQHSNQIAAFIAEPIVGCGGQVPLPKGYLKNVYAKIRAQGGVCISDEVQVGFGRLGDFFWGFEMHEVEPDLVILGKPMGNGHPIGAVVTTSEIAKSFEQGPEFFSSFGGNPVSCAIGNAVLNVIETENLQLHAKQVGDYFVKKLLKLKKKYPCIADIRGSGLFLGIEILTPTAEPATKLAAEIKNHLRDQHILIGTDGPFNNILKIKPPLSFTSDNVDQVVKVLQLYFELKK